MKKISYKKVIRLENEKYQILFQFTHTHSKAGKSIPVADALSRVCFKAGADVHNAGADLNRAGADLNKAGADLNKVGADVNKEIHFITAKSCPIDIKSIQ